MQHQKFYSQLINDYCTIVYKQIGFYIMGIFFYRGILSQTFTIHRTAGEGGSFLQLLSTTSTYFTYNGTLAGRLRQRAHLCTQLMTGLQPETLALREVFKYGVISGPYFPVFSPNAGKYGPEITPYLDIFHAVLVSE